MRPRRISREDAELIGAIIDRLVNEEILKADSRTRAVLSLVACHTVVPLDLERMLTGRVIDLVHDLAGISVYLDREEMVMRDCFRPRFAKPREKMH